MNFELIKYLNHRLTRIKNDQLENRARIMNIRGSIIDLYHNFLNPNSNPEVFSGAICPKCLGAKIIPPKELLRMASQIDRIRPKTNTEIDQCPLGIYDLALRVSMINEYWDPTKTAIAFVGDDDLASLLLSRYTSVKDLFVIDIDSRILNLIGNEPRKPNHSTHTLELNLIDFKNSLQKINQFYGRYDLVISDPPYAVSGMLTFIYYATTLLKLGGEIHLAVPYLRYEDWSHDLLEIVQGELLKLGFLITNIFPSFYTYQNDEVQSSLLIAQKRRLTPINIIEEYLGLLNIHKFYTTRKKP